jgi:hypothetical protein
MYSRDVLWHGCLFPEVWHIVGTVVHRQLADCWVALVGAWMTQMFRLVLTCAPPVVWLQARCRR